LTLSACLISCSAPLIMALIDPAWPYWYAAFWAVLLSPISADVLFTVAATLITSTFPPDRQAMGGAVFSTCSQLGVSVGLAVFAVVSSSVAHHLEEQGESNALMSSYRAAFWTMFACSVLSLILGAVSLRHIGALGVGKTRSSGRTAEN